MTVQGGDVENARPNHNGVAIGEAKRTSPRALGSKVPPTYPELSTLGMFFVWERDGEGRSTDAAARAHCKSPDFVEERGEELASLLGRRRPVTDDQWKRKRWFALVSQRPRGGVRRTEMERRLSK